MRHVFLKKDHEQLKDVTEYVLLLPYSNEYKCVYIDDVTGKWMMHGGNYNIHWDQRMDALAIDFAPSRADLAEESIFTQTFRYSLFVKSTPNEFLNLIAELGAS